MNKRLEIEYPENGKKCREILKTITPAKDEPNSSLFKMAIFAVMPFLALIIFMHILAEFNPPDFVVFVGALFATILPIGVGIGIAFELYRKGFKYQEEFYSYIQPFLKIGERCIAFTYGAESKKVSWSENFGILTYFVFQPTGYLSFKLKNRSADILRCIKKLKKT